ncbi:hypothetical protein B0H16DRAFT_125744 [Mycena metata]|uniref:Uncharacterized protein n=1 Tax=Mycena metata TaxID=1033252 RepID=A0AAD7I6N0_9AGAR|nr:hypothetical protein B0H16DRAFT_125744 [Mycena metata]
MQEHGHVIIRTCLLRPSRFLFPAIMAAKTLSTSTLSLKFMQNAHRAKNIAEVQLERAEVKDDGEWEVAKEIRDAWGPETTQSVSYEASYLPFLFSSDASDAHAIPATNLKGRRAFKRGMEVADEYQFSAPAPPTPPAAASTSKSTGKPRQISSLSGRTGSNTNNSKKGSANAAPKGKTARQAIYDNSGVGADLRSQKATESMNDYAPPLPSKPPLPNVFLKPAGVDAPPESSKTPLATGSGERKPKRERESEPTGEAGADGETTSLKKRKRKKKVDEQAAGTKDE